jgi:hypothetical protein
VRWSKKPEQIVDGVDPRFWESRFQSWMLSEVVPLGALLVALETQSYAIETGLISPAVSRVRHCVLPGSRVRLLPRHIKALKVRIAERIRAEGGEVSTDAITVRSADGVTFTIHMSIRPMQSAP